MVIASRKAGTWLKRLGGGRQRLNDMTLREFFGLDAGTAALMGIVSDEQQTETKEKTALEVSSAGEELQRPGHARGEGRWEWQWCWCGRLMRE